VERSDPRLTPPDELFLQRAYELAARGVGNTAPNPPVGAVVVRDGRPVGEGYHHRAGAPHAEAEALRQAGAKAVNATLYVSVEPCGHTGRTPPCSQAVIDAGVARVVAGTLDPAGHGGAAQLRERGVDVAIAGDSAALDLIEMFVRASRSQRPYVAVKMATSLDGAIARERGVRERLSSEKEWQYVRELRVAHDAVMVGAGTVRVDDPQLTVRPRHDRVRPYVRIVVCETDVVPASCRVFGAEEGYAKTILVAPAGLRRRLEELQAAADILCVGEPDSLELDLGEALKAVRKRGICSVLCEGGPRLAASLIAGGLADRFYWAIAPVFLHNYRAVPVLDGVDLAALGLRARFDRVERLGDDVMLSGSFDFAAAPLLSE
jgi:diaminohydroxyphosphoribosylaminopyrimidine deaminase/5-amino-6-(5-phosphoribosylamino)uracil reductase